MAAGDNGGSYQQRQHVAGTYQEIPNGASPSDGRHVGPKKWLTGGALVLAIGAVYSIPSMTMHSSSQMMSMSHSVRPDKAFANDSNLLVQANGKLKLFDSLSTFTCFYDGSIKLSRRCCKGK